MIYIKIFFILLILLLSYLIIESKFNINSSRHKSKEEFIQLNELKKSVSFADENNKPLEIIIKFNKII